MNSFLTRQEIAESAGTEQLEELEELEIVFNGFDEIAALEFCPHLRRLTFIDNGLKRISNLHPVSTSLVSLCLCDQELTAMDNLALPQLRELFLHRNEIRRIGNLSGCPRLRKLWLCQNALEQISGLHAVPELEECWLQANLIKKLSGLENCPRLQSLGLAGNPIGDLREVKRLSSGCPALRLLSFSDIHFGRCLLVDEAGYKEFIALHLPQVHVLDGIVSSKEALITAEDMYYAQVKSFNQSLLEIDDAYQRDLAAIEAQHQARESYSNVLEKEMSAALRELQSLVNEGRGAISKQLQRQSQLLVSSSATLVNSLQQLENGAKCALRENLDVIRSEFDSSASMLCLLEQVAAADSTITNLLCAISAASKSTTAAAVSVGAVAIVQPTVVFQSISSNTADFQLMAAVIRREDSVAEADTVSISSKRKGAAKSAAAAIAKVSSDLEVARLYRIAMSSSLLAAGSRTIAAATGDWGFAQSSQQQQQQLLRLTADSVDVSYERVFTVLTAEMLEVLLLQGWAALPTTMLFSTDADLMCALHGCVGMSMPSPPEAASGDYWKLLQRLDDGSNSEHGDSDEQTLHRLQSALSSQLFLLVCCRFITARASFHELGTAAAPLVLQLPPNQEQKSQFMSELQRTGTARKLQITSDGSSNSGSSSSIVYLLPPSICSSCVEIDFLALCVSQQQHATTAYDSNSSGAWLRQAEYRLEPLLLPCTHVDHTAHILATYEAKAADEVSKYMDRLLEEVSGQQASALLQSEREVALGERSLKGMRDEVEQERRQQEALLREMRQAADGFTAPTAATATTAVGAAGNSSGGAGASNPHLVGNYGRLQQRNLSKR